MTHYTSVAVVTPQDVFTLKGFIGEWLNAGRDVSRLSSEQRHDIQLHLPVQAYWGVDHDGRLSPAWLDDTSRPGFDVAAGIFIRIAADVDRWRLTGPCPGCHNYFLRETRRERKFCSRCRRYESRPRMRDTREKRRQAYLKLAKKVLADWAKHGNCENWQTWTAREINRHIALMTEQRKNPLNLTPITGKALTRWLNDEKRQSGTGIRVPTVVKGLAKEKSKCHTKEGTGFGARLAL